MLVEEKGREEERGEKEVRGMVREREKGVEKCKKEKEKKKIEGMTWWKKRGRKAEDDCLIAVD
jgi:hypothetical protein